jgi:hypothetical protein
LVDRKSAAVLKKSPGGQKTGSLLLRGHDDHQESHCEVAER